MPLDPPSSPAPPSPLVSVALCTYNGARWLDAQIASVLAQRDVNLELIVVDDDSTDATWPLLEAWAARDPRIRLHRNQPRLGTVRNFERAFELCRGAWIAPCDQDDVWQPEKLSALLAHADGAAMVWCDSRLVDAQGEPLGANLSERVRMGSLQDIVALCFGNMISGHAMLFPRSLLQRALPMPPVAFHDWWLAAVAMSVGPAVFVDRPLVDYRQHDGTQTDVLLRRRSRRDPNHIFESRDTWLRQIASIPSADQAWLQRLSALWFRRRTQWFCPRLVLHIAQHAGRIMWVNPREPFWRFAFKQFLGHRWRARPSPSSPS